MRQQQQQHHKVIHLTDVFAGLLVHSFPSLLASWRLAGWVILYFNPLFLPIARPYACIYV